MRKLLSRDPLFLPVLVTCAYVLVDLVLDYRLHDSAYFSLAHIAVVGAVLLLANVLMVLASRSRRRADAVLRQAQEELEIRVRDRTAELEEANQHLQLEIAERRRAEQALRVSEGTARGLMNASSESAVLIDTEGIVLAANETAARGLGLSVEQMLGACLFDFFPPGVAAQRRLYLAKALETGLPGRYQDERGGRTFEIHVEPIRDAEGNVVRMAAFGLDVTELRLADQALRASEEKYRLFFQNMAEGFALYELLYNEGGEPVDWRILEVNEAYSRHTGIVPAQIVGRRASELFPEAIGTYLPKFVDVVASQAPATFETYAAAVGRHQRISTFPAGGNRFANMIEDISERKQAAEALRSSEEKFATVFRFSPDVIGIVSAQNGTVIDVNEAFTTLLGHERSDVIGTKFEELGLLPVADGAKAVELLEANEQVLDLELDLTTRSGGVATMLVSLIPITVNEESSILIIAKDITARKQSEEALREAQAELGRGIEARAALEERQRLARELHDSVSQALYAASLGINTALTLFDTDREKVLEALHYALSMARACLTEMRALIFELRPESLEMEGLVLALTRQVDALRARHGVEIGLTLCEEPELPLTAKAGLYRIAQEALQNAVRHAQPTRLDVRLSRTAASLVLEVCDNGVGFDPLQEYPGHMGLQSMRERAEGLGGVLNIVSAPDCGTQIRLSIPIPGDSEETPEDVAEPDGAQL